MTLLSLRMAAVSHWGSKWLLGLSQYLPIGPRTPNRSFGIQVSMLVSTPLTQNSSMLQSRAYKIADHKNWMKELTALCVCLCSLVSETEKDKETETEKRDKQRVIDAVGIPEPRNYFPLSHFVSENVTVCLQLVRG